MCEGIGTDIVREAVVFKSSPFCSSKLSHMGKSVSTKQPGKIQISMSKMQLFSYSISVFLLSVVNTRCRNIGHLPIALII